VKSINKETLKSWLGLPELVLLDVRSPQAFEQSIAKIEMAKRVEPAQLPTLARLISKNKKVVLYCENGKTQCPMLAQELGRMGFKEVYVLEGGWLGWSGKDYPPFPRTTDDPPRRRFPSGRRRPQGLRLGLVLAGFVAQPGTEPEVIHYEKISGGGGKFQMIIRMPKSGGRHQDLRAALQKDKRKSEMADIIVNAGLGASGTLAAAPSISVDT
jgi:rhodanese-related sulfurtransferase